MDEARERELAEALARMLDEQAAEAPVTEAPCAELAEELAALAEVDDILDEPVALPAPAQLSGHRILSEIGSGGMGRVFLAADEALGRQVAIKTLAARFASNPVLRARFMAEARAMARLNHPNIARIYSLGPAGEPPHFVMELLDGTPLNRAAGPLTFQQRAALLLRVGQAVQFLHEHGILHRDLKPANILVSADLEPKLLDFGLALDLAAQERLSQIGEIAGTPEYLSPEQAAGRQELTAASDVFALGAILYELLTGRPPFQAATLTELLRRIREVEPTMPRSHIAAIPRDLQNICLKALEKDPAHRYASAREMADDLRRFLAGEPVLAEPAAYARLISAQVAHHLRELESWQHDQIISAAEHDALRTRYQKLIEREDSWILQARRLTLPQVTLYLGAWILAVGAAFLTFFPYPALTGFPAIVTAWAAAAPMAWIGIRTWRAGYLRVAIAYLLTLCLTVPVAILVSLEELKVFTALTWGDPKLELFHRLEFAKQATNAQVWWALAAALPVAWWLRRFTRAQVFSLMFATMAALLCLATLLRMGLFHWVDNDPGRLYFHLIPCAALFMIAGFTFERLRLPDDSRYFYPFAVVFTWAALTGVALFHEPYAQWLKAAAPWTRGQLEYLFIVNAAIYFVLDRACDRFASTQIRMVGKSFRFVIPGHVLTSLLLLGINAKAPAEARALEWLLPGAACVFVFAAISRQMKNFLVSGLLFFAAGVYRLQQNVFQDRAIWPITLLCVGLALMMAAANYARIRVAIRNFVRR
ncbi:MAG TPA: serine/threonine-protein kinase [Paludibaculum sp.]|jgi:serine/threonine protein kinase